MRQALDDLTEALDAETSGHPAEEIDLEELREWIFEAQGPGTFEWLCDAVEIDVGRARSAINTYWARRLDGEQVGFGVPRILPNNGRMRVVVKRARSRRPRLGGSPRLVERSMLEAG